MEPYLEYEIHAVGQLEENQGCFLTSGVGMTPHKMAALFLQNYDDRAK